MPDPALPLYLLLDQNVPREIAAWLRAQRPIWKISHASEVGLSTKADEEIFLWAQSNHAVVVTFDEDFADARFFPLGHHHGVVRLRVWPTTIEETQRAIERLLTQVPESDIAGSLIIIDQEKIRLRRKP